MQEIKSLILAYRAELAGQDKSKMTNERRAWIANQIKRCNEVLR